MKTIFTIVLLISLMCIACFCIYCIVKCSINIYVGYKNKKSYTPPYFSEGGGIVFNKKTKKLEATGGEIKLPFE